MIHVYFSASVANCEKARDFVLKEHVDVPVIIFLMKSRCPGASMMVNWYFDVEKFDRVISMVMPRSRSDLRLSTIQAYLKEAFPT